MGVLSPSQLVSSLLHLGGALVFLALARGLLARLGTDPRVRLTAAAHVLCVCFLLGASGAFHGAHYLHGMTATTAALLRVDRAGVWILFAGFFLLPHVVLLRGAWRWGPLAVVGLVAAAGVASCGLGDEPSTALEAFVPYAAASAVGLASTGKLLRERGPGYARWLLLFWAAFGVASLFFILRPPDLVPGVFGHHEVWHLGVLAGIGAHWRFLWHIAPEARQAFDAPASALRLEGPAAGPCA